MQTLQSFLYFTFRESNNQSLHWLFNGKFTGQTLAQKHPDDHTEMQFQNVIKLKFLSKYSPNFPSFVPNSQAVQADIEIDTSYQYL